MHIITSKNNYLNANIIMDVFFSEKKKYNKKVDIIILFVTHNCR